MRYELNAYQKLATGSKRHNLSHLRSQEYSKVKNTVKLLQNSAHLLVIIIERPVNSKEKYFTKQSRYLNYIFRSYFAQIQINKNCIE